MMRLKVEVLLNELYISLAKFSLELKAPAVLKLLVLLNALFFFEFLLEA